MENIINYPPCEDWFLQDPMPKYIDPRETPVIPWKYRKILNPKYNLKQQAQASPEQIEKYGRIYRRIPDLDTIWQGEVIDHDGVSSLIYYILYELV